jgi:8-oxo-dGTP pyrophosphatase MutT (NUDIX family)
MEKTNSPRDVPGRLWESLVRPLLHSYWRFTRGMTLGVRGLVVDGAGRILLVQHSYVRGWHLPGGGVEPGETMLQALARELAEEGNIRLSGPPRLHGIFFNRCVSRRDHVAVYLVQDFEQDGPFRPNREIAVASFFALDALPNDTTAGTRARIAEIIGGAPVSEHW